MNATNFAKVCYRTEQQDEEVLLHNLNNGETGFSFGCTKEGETVQVRLANGELDSWGRDECAECDPE